MKLSYKKTMLIGLAFLSISAFWQMYDNVIPLILTNTFHMGDTVTGFIMAIDNVLALFLLPLFGALSDRINTKIGKRMPFILLGTGLAFVFINILSYADHVQNLILFVGVLFLLLVSMGLYRSPAVALMPDLTEKPLRSKGNAVINLMGAVGGVITLVMIKVLVGGGSTPDYRPLFFALSTLMVVAIIVLFLTIKENKLRGQMPEETEEEVEDNSSETSLSKGKKKSLILILCSVSLWFIAYNAVTTAFSRYATHVWGLENGGYADCLLIATVAAIASYIPIGFLASRIGRKKTILMGVIVITSCYLVAGLFNTYHPIMVVFFGLIGFAWAAINVNSLPMVVEICSASDVGKYTGYYYTFSMAAQVVTPILSGALLEHVSYRTLFPYAVLFSIGSFCTMFFVKHGDSRPQKKESILENFDVED